MTVFHVEGGPVESSDQTDQGVPSGALLRTEVLSDLGMSSAGASPAMCETDKCQLMFVLWSPLAWNGLHGHLGGPLGFLEEKTASPFCAQEVKHKEGREHSQIKVVQSKLQSLCLLIAAGPWNPRGWEERCKSRGGQACLRTAGCCLSGELTLGP